MEAGTGQRTSPLWRALYEAAVLEIDPEQLPLRIVAAEIAISHRMQDLDHCGDGSERDALIDALQVLRDLRKMADENGSGR